MNGFFLKRLQVIGAGLTTAEVNFVLGLNVIAGPSDTGKSFILQCINFALGASDPPKEILEVKGYDRILLSLEIYREPRVFTLERSLQGGDIQLYEGLQAERPLAKLKRKHSKSGKSLSQFLLELCSLSDTKLRKNASGETRALSFRDFARLTVVDEETVIAERSPIHSGRPVSKTPESALFRYVLTGTDDSSLVAVERPNLAKVRRAGRSEIIEDLSSKIRVEMSSLLSTEPDRASVQVQLVSLDTELRNISESLQAERDAVNAVELQRREKWREARKIESRLSVLMELKLRFSLLREHYLSDLARLTSITEAANRLGELPEEQCPLCGALAKHQHADDAHLELSPSQVEEACQAESAKVAALQADLASTVANTDAEIGSLKLKLENRNSAFRSLDEQLRSELNPKIQTKLRRLAEANSAREPLLRAMSLFERLDYLEGLSNEATQTGAVRAIPAASPGADETAKFNRCVEELLKAWDFPGSERVTFSEKDEDIVISGRRRASHGKGVRAITHAAFILGLLLLTARENLPHPGFVVIDSPLVVYRAPEKGDSLPPKVKENFYRSTAKMFGRQQIIVIENEDPPVDLESANVIKFTKSELGRKGFIPERDTGL